MNLHLDLNTLVGVLASALLIATAKLLWNTSVNLARLTERVDGHEKRIETVEEKIS